MYVLSSIFRSTRQSKKRLETRKLPGICIGVSLAAQNVSKDVSNIILDRIEGSIQASKKRNVGRR